MYHAFLFLLSIRRRPHSSLGGDGWMILPEDTSPSLVVVVVVLLARLSDVRFADFTCRRRTPHAAADKTQTSNDAVFIGRASPHYHTHLLT